MWGSSGSSGRRPFCGLHSGRAQCFLCRFDTEQPVSRFTFGLGSPSEELAESLRFEAFERTWRRSRGRARCASRSCLTPVRVSAQLNDRQQDDVFQ